MSADGSGPQKPIPPGLRPFPKGVSGNPGGKAAGMREVEALARSKAPACIEILFGIASDEKAPKPARVGAATAILDRAYGRPRQAVDINDNRPLATLPADELLTALAAVRAAREARG